MNAKNRAMLRQSMAYGALAAGVLICLHVARSSYLLLDLRLEFYLLLVGVPLMAVGVLLGRWMGSRKSNNARQTTVEGTLTNKELAVLAAVAEGLSNQQVADRLYLSVSTIKSHLQSVYGKLGVQRRTQAVEHARRLKMLP